MNPNRRPGLLLRCWAWLRARLKPGAASPTPPLSDRQRALALIAAVDAGGVPMIPRRINEIARGLGLEVSPRAPVEETIDRIRAAVARAGS